VGDTGRFRPRLFFLPSISHHKKGRWAKKSLPTAFFVLFRNKNLEDGAFIRMIDEHKSRAHSLWRNRDYLLLQGGQLVSFIGDQQQFVALPLLVLALTGSAVQAGIAIGLNTIAIIVVSPIAGALVDRWNRKVTMVLCDTGRMFITLTIPLAFWLHALTMVQIYVAVALTGVLRTIFSVANTVALPNVVAQEQLPEALAQSQSAYTSIRIFGALVSGTLYAIGAVLPFLVNAASFAVSVFSLGLIRGNFQKSTETGEDGPRQSLSSAITEGFTWLWKQPLIRFLTLVDGADSLRYGAGYLVIIVLAQNLHISSTGIGAIFTAAAVGSLLGNLVSAWARKRFRFGTIAVSMFWLQALVFPLYALAPNAIVMGLIAVAEEFIGPIYDVPLNTYRLISTPDSLRGRMSSTVQLITQGAQSVGAILSGILIQAVGAKYSALILGAWLIMLAIITTLNRRARNASLEL
jgi:MFS family permease